MGHDRWGVTLAIDEREWEHGRRTTTDVGRGEKGCVVSASSNTPSYSQAEQVLSELRSIRRTIEQLERTMAGLPSKMARELSNHSAGQHDRFATSFGDVALGISAGAFLILAVNRILTALLG